MKIALYHGILWSKYKAGVFSEMHRMAPECNAEVRFIQIAETDSDRKGLSGVDLDRHRYPYELLFKGEYGGIPKVKLAWAVFRNVFWSDADLVLLPGFSDVAHWSMLLGAVLSGKRRAVFCDSTLRDRTQVRFKSVLKRFFFGLCDGYLTYGRRGREYLVHYRANPAKVFQRVQAAAMPRDYSVQGARQARILVAGSSDAPVFLYVGRLSQEKAIDVLLRAFAEVAIQMPGATLRIVGGGAERQELIRLRDVLGITASVNFVGSLDLEDLASEYARATCFVLPSHSEPWGLVVNEALHFGCAVVVSDNCGCVPELVIEGKTGFSFRAGDVEDLSKKLTKSVSAFSDVEATAEECFKVISSFTPDRAARQTLEACACLLARSK